jgi:hypothetical protein
MNSRVEWVKTEKQNRRKGKKGKEWKRPSGIAPKYHPTISHLPTVHTVEYPTVKLPKLRPIVIRGFPLQQPTYSHRRPADARSDPPSCHLHSNQRP